MHRPRPGRWAIFALAIAGLALSLGTRATSGAAVPLRPAAGDAGVVSTPIRALDVVLRTDDTTESLTVRVAESSRPFVLLLAAAGLILTGARSRRSVSRAAAAVRWRSPRRHAVALRAPPSPRLI